MKREIIKFKIAKRNFYRTILQKAADRIIGKMENVKTDEEFNGLYNVGLQIDLWATHNFNIYLK